MIDAPGLPWTPRGRGGHREVRPLGAFTSIKSAGTFLELKLRAEEEVCLAPKDRCVPVGLTIRCWGGVTTMVREVKVREEAMKCRFRAQILGRSSGCVTLGGSPVPLSLFPSSIERTGGVGPCTHEPLPKCKETTETSFLNVTYSLLAPSPLDGMSFLFHFQQLLVDGWLTP